MVQYSRGVAPAECIAHVAQTAALRELPYVLITGKTIPDAQNEAVEIARAQHRDLLLCEDDFVATDKQWSEMMEAPQVAVCHAYVSPGALNAQHRRYGLYFTGTVFVKIALSVIVSYGQRKLFQPWGGDFSGSDYWFWTKLREHCPGIDIRECGIVDHYRHNHWKKKHEPSSITILKADKS